MSNKVTFMPLFRYLSGTLQQALVIIQELMRKILNRISEKSIGKNIVIKRVKLGMPRYTVL